MPMNKENDSKKRILIVDDTARSLNDANAAVKAMGYDTVAVSSAEEGLGILEKGGIDLVIVDNDMPKTSGLKMVEMMRQNKNHTPVIIVTSLLPELRESTAKRLKVSDYLNKNLHSERAKRVIAHTLGVHAESV